MIIRIMSCIGSSEAAKKIRRRFRLLLLLLLLLFDGIRRGKKMSDILCVISNFWFDFFIWKRNSFYSIVRGVFLKYESRCLIWYLIFHQVSEESRVLFAESVIYVSRVLLYEWYRTCFRVSPSGDIYIQNPSSTPSS